MIRALAARVLRPVARVLAELGERLEAKGGLRLPWKDPRVDHVEHLPRPSPAAKEDERP